MRYKLPCVLETNKVGLKLTFTCLSVKLQKHRNISPYCLKHLYFHEKNDRNMTMNHSAIKNNKHSIVNVTLSSIIRNKYEATAWHQPVPQTKLNSGLVYLQNSAKILVLGPHHLSMHPDWSVKKAIVNLPIRLKVNLKCTSGNLLSPPGSRTRISTKWH